MRALRSGISPRVLPCVLALAGCSDHRFGFFPDSDSDGSSTTTLSPTTLSPTTLSPTTLSPTTVNPTTDPPDTDTATSLVPTTSTTMGTECGQVFIEGDLPLHVVLPLGGQGDTFALSCGGSGGADVGAIWRAPVTGQFQIDTIGSGFDTVLGVLAGSCSGGELVCDDDGGGALTSRLELHMTAGQEVTIVVDSFFEGGEVALNISVLPNDETCPDAVFESVVPLEIVGKTAGAPNLRSASCGGADSPEIEAEWTAPFDGLFRFEVLEANFDPVMYLLAEDCDGPALACNDDAIGLMPAFETLLVGGQRVVVVVDGVFGSGDFSLRITEG